MSRWWSVMGQGGRSLFALAMFCALSGPSRADVRIEGEETALRVITDHAPVGEVLAALKAKFRLRYHASVDPDRQVSGTLSGTLHRVVVRLLDGYDFVVRRSPEGVEIVQVAPRGGANAQRIGRSAAPVWRASMRQADTQTPR